MIDFTQLGINAIQKSINPRDIFMGLSGKSAKYQYPRDVQGEVWKQWFERRNEKDIVIKMNTGSGKTVVALLILQSCLNEGIGPAVYVVPDRYLTEQVMSQAGELGIKVTASETDLSFQRKKAILVTTIQKLVNGKSVFGMRNENNYTIGSIVIDDMHACIGHVQEQFSIEIPCSDPVYSKITQVFVDDMKAQASARFSDILERRDLSDSMLIPFWCWQDKSQAVYQLLSENREKDYILFKIDLIRDSLKASHCYISANSISIIPNCIPMNKIKGFDDAVRRIYMSATLPDDSPFVTVMGIDFKDNEKAITPEKANDIGERLIIVPKIINQEMTETEVRNAIIEKADDYNVVVLVPSFAMSKYWEVNGGIVLSSKNISQGIDTIKGSNHGLYVIVNRYDGIDLPDDACRILVIDGLPDISNMNDKYEHEVVRKSERIRRELVQRIEQGMGRGVRSNNDYCLIYLIGNQLTNALYQDEGYHYFSNATYQQFELSERMCEQIEGGSLQEIMDIGDYILKRNPSWIALCKNATAGEEYDPSICVSDFAKASRASFDYCMHGDYNKAAESMNSLSNNEKNARMKGYYKQLLAEYTNFSDKSAAQNILRSAKSDNLEVLNPIEGISNSKHTNILLDQSNNIIDYINRLNTDRNGFVIHVQSILDDLKFEVNTAKKFENAVQEVFTIIGYSASQPEREYGRGPDDFVILGAGQYLVIECKNGTITETINKHDCNQLNGSYNWCVNQYQDDKINCTPIMIHNSCIFSYECSPHQSIRIMTPDLLDKFKVQVNGFVTAMVQENNYKNTGKIKNLLYDYKLGRESLVNEYTVPFHVKGR